MVGAIEWADLGLVGAFGAGLLIGAVFTVRLAKVLASFLADLRRREEEPPSSTK